MDDSQTGPARQRIFVHEAAARPLVVMYLYVHGKGERFFYPSVRAQSSAARVAVRYLECALTQAASLRLGDSVCEVALATNVSDPSALGADGEALMARMEELGVRMLETEYEHHPGEDTETYVSSRYVLDAILSATAGEPSERRLWLTDLDCVWPDPDLMFANAPEREEIGCVPIDYDPDWDPVGFGEHGLTRRALGDLAVAMGAEPCLPTWIGGELLTGTVAALRDLVRVCEELDGRLAAMGVSVPTEEQILTLAGAMGQARFRDLSHAARRMSTGPRNRAAIVENPLALGLWHLPSEKGLSLRRTAREVRNGRLERLRRDLSDPARAARRFNVAGVGPMRQLQDDGWIATQRLLGAAGSALARRA
jgi:hypothetical protein